jgi:hypothetical protein
VPGLEATSAAAAITSEQGLPLAVERSMYWNANGIFWAGGSNGMGIAAPVP